MGPGAARSGEDMAGRSPLPVGLPSLRPFFASSPCRSSIPARQTLRRSSGLPSFRQRLIPSAPNDSHFCAIDAYPLRSVPLALQRRVSYPSRSVPSALLRLSPLSLPSVVSFFLHIVVYPFHFGHIAPLLRPCLLSPSLRTDRDSSGSSFRYPFRSGKGRKKPGRPDRRRLVVAITTTMIPLSRWDRRRGVSGGNYASARRSHGRTDAMHKIAFATHHMENQTIGGAYR